MRVWGAVFLVLAFVICGSLVASNYNRRIKELEEWRRILKYLESEVIYSARILEEALERVQDYTSVAIKNLFEQCRQQLIEGAEMEQAFKKGWEQYEKCMCLTKEDEKILWDFAQRIGKGDLEQEKNSFLFVYRQLEERIDFEKEKSMQRTKLCRTLFAAVGLGLVLILY